MDTQITRLTRQDAAKLRALNELFGLVFNDPATYQQHAPDHEYLTAFLDDSSHIVLVAANDNRVVGGLVAYALPKFEQARKEIYLYDLAVATEVQRQGIGKKLMDALCRIAREMGAYVVFAQADEGDEAIHFYESLQPIENLKTRNFDFNVK